MFDFSKPWLDPFSSYKENEMNINFNNITSTTPLPPFKSGNIVQILDNEYAPDEIMASTMAMVIFSGSFESHVFCYTGHTTRSIDNRGLGFMAASYDDLKDLDKSKIDLPIVGFNLDRIIDYRYATSTPEHEPMEGMVRIIDDRGGMSMGVHIEIKRDACIFIAFDGHKPEEFMWITSPELFRMLKEREAKRDKTSLFKEKESMIKTAVWPDNDWCNVEDLDDYKHKSDDYIIVDVSLDDYEKGNFSYDELIQRLNKENNA